MERGCLEKHLQISCWISHHSLPGLSAESIMLKKRPGSPFHDPDLLSSKLSSGEKYWEAKLQHLMPYCYLTLSTYTLQPQIHKTYMESNKKGDKKLSSSNPWNLNRIWVVIIHPVLETGHHQVNSLLAQINLLSENGNFFWKKAVDVSCWCVLET